MPCTHCTHSKHSAFDVKVSSALDVNITAVIVIFVVGGEQYRKERKGKVFI